MDIEAAKFEQIGLGERMWDAIKIFAVSVGFGRTIFRLLVLLAFAPTEIFTSHLEIELVNR